jgi:hypothetical protein
MSTQITLELPDELYEQAQQWAAITQQDLSATLTDALSLALIPLPRTNEPPVADLSDEEVLAMTKTRLTPAQGHRLSELLAKQRENELSETERAELQALMHYYYHLWIQQSEALAEAVARGLRPPLAS